VLSSTPAEVRSHCEKEFFNWADLLLIVSDFKMSTKEEDDDDVLVTSEEMFDHVLHNVLRKKEDSDLKKALQRSGFITVTEIIHMAVPQMTFSTRLLCLLPAARQRLTNRLWDKAIIVYSNRSSLVENYVCVITLTGPKSPAVISRDGTIFKDASPTKPTSDDAKLR
jgi:hypothetical protein